MLYALLSPAKKLDFALDSVGLKPTKPELLAEAEPLIQRVKGYKVADLKRLMELSDKLAKLNFERFQAFDVDNSIGTKPAIFAFNGDVYVGFDAKTLSPADITFAQKHIGILSGLYGLLRPLDAIQPYRLEMGTAVDTKAGKNLYDYWRKALTKHLNATVAAKKGATIINLASDEYWSAIDAKSLKAPVVQCAFKEIKNGKATIISFLAKKARGMMARHIVTTRAETPDDLKEFNAGGYRFDDKSSRDDLLVFSRKAA